MCARVHECWAQERGDWDEKETRRMTVHAFHSHQLMDPHIFIEGEGDVVVFNVVKWE